MEVREEGIGAGRNSPGQYIQKVCKAIHGLTLLNDFIKPNIGAIMTPNNYAFSDLNYQTVQDYVVS